jgi:hypothetical protein
LHTVLSFKPTPLCPQLRGKLTCDFLKDDE